MYCSCYSNTGCYNVVFHDPELGAQDQCRLPLWTIMFWGIIPLEPLQFCSIPCMSLRPTCQWHKCAPHISERSVAYKGSQNSIFWIGTACPSGTWRCFLHEAMDYPRWTPPPPDTHTWCAFIDGLSLDILKERREPKLYDTNLGETDEDLDWFRAFGE
jgi:hypothetical protein